MTTYVLISCVSKKKDTDKPIEARLLYDSTFFHKAWAYAEALKPNKTLILSAKYGLIDPETKISTYNETLKGKSVAEQKSWADNVLTKFRAEFGYNKDEDEVIILAGKAYHKYLIGEDRIERYVLPYKGCKGIGYILSLLNKEIARLSVDNKQQ